MISVFNWCLKGWKKTGKKRGRETSGATIKSGSLKGAEKEKELARKIL